MENKTALITGGSGYLGSHLAKKLYNENWNVIVFDKVKPNHQYHNSYHVGDIRDRASLNYVFGLHKIDTVFHLAGRIEVGLSNIHPTEFWDVNVGGTVTLLNVMKKFNVENLVFSSSAAVYWAGNVPIKEDECIINNSVYGNTKHACEMAIEDSGLNYVIFRYFNLAGADPGGTLGEVHEPETHLIPVIFEKLNSFVINGNDYKTGDGTCVRDYVHVSDVADAHFAAANYLTEGKPPVVLNLGTGVGHSVLEIIQLIEKHLGLEVNYTFGKNRAGDPDKLVANIDLAKEVLNFEPKHDIISILGTAYAWYKTRIKR